MTKQAHSKNSMKPRKGYKYVLIPEIRAQIEVPESLDEKEAIERYLKKIEITNLHHVSGREAMKLNKQKV